jgi:hypothetical protein
MLRQGVLRVTRFDFFSDDHSTGSKSHRFFARFVGVAIRSLAAASPQFASSFFLLARTSGSNFWLELNLNLAPNLGALEIDVACTH